MYLVFVYLLLPLLVLSAQNQQLFRAPTPHSLAVRPSSAFGDSRAENIEELALTDIVLTASVDGKFHAFNRTNGQLKWSMRDVQSNPQSYPLLHELVRTDHTSRDIHEDDVESDDIYIIEPQSGEIFVVPPGSSASTPLERLPFTIPQLVEMSPFRFVGDDQRMFLGRKETSIVTLDLDTGSVISIYADRCMWDEANATTAGETNDLTGVLDESDAFESKVPQGKIRSQRREIHIGRTDYHVAVHIRGRGIVQNLSFSVYGPNNVDRERQLAWTRTQDDRYLQPLTDGQIMSFRTSKNPGDPLEWSNKLSHPTVAVFDVLTISSRRDPIVLLQPRPPLTELFTSPSHRSQIASLPDSTYVGLIGESLYAMSHLNYPLVAFSRRGAGRRRVALHAGSELVLPDDEDNSCSTLECLVGTHQSEYAASSRLSRLLDSGTKLHIDGANHDPDPGDDIPTLNSNSVQPSPLLRIAHPPRQWRASWIQGAGALLLGLIGYLSFYPSSVSSQQSFSDEAPVDVAPDQKPITPHETTMSTMSRSVPTPKTIHSKPTPKSSEETDPEDDLPVDSDGVGKSRRKQKPRNRGRGKKGKSRVVLDEGELPVTYTEEGTMDKSDDFVRVDLPQTLNPVDFTVAGAALPITQNTPDIPAVFPPRPMESTLTVFEGSESALGFGSHGTVVYRGSFQGRAVAVKRLLQDFVTVASREVALLQESDDHPNVIRYFYQESRNNFLYIALELCPASLEDILRHPNIFPEIAAVFHPKKALAQITAGLQHLHSLKIVHRDIKPQNILISQAKNGVHRMLISDFGLCKKLGTDETSFLPTQHGPLGAGTVGWRAPEILRGEVNLDVSTIDSLGSMDQEENSSTVGSLGGPGLTSGSGTDHGNRMRLTKSVDIFALGCLFFYTLTCGEHPFGGPFDRESNILKDEKDLSWLERLGEEGEEVSDLISKMLNPQPKLRLDTTACLIHPFFWTPARRLGFLQDASDRFEIMGRDPPEPGLISLETNAYDVVGVDWHRRLDKTLIDNLGKFRKYNGKSVQDLLRALRNKKHHYQDLPENVKRHLGPLPEGFLNYFTRRFPRLFLHVYYVIATSLLRHEPMFKSYFELHDL